MCLPGRHDTAAIISAFQEGMDVDLTKCEGYHGILNWIDRFPSKLLAGVSTALYLSLLVVCMDATFP
jgi:hypothetical protein